MRKTDMNLLRVTSIAELANRLELPRPRHPLITLINYDAIPVKLADKGSRFSLDFYKISFKTGFHGQVRYGQGHYDFDDGGLAFLGPHQIVTMSDAEESYEGYSLFFHPDLLKGYTLGSQIARFGFFSYGIAEALYLSDQEKQLISGIFAAIQQELYNNTDLFSQDILVSQIELLLHHSNRFYNRQFITRKSLYDDLIARMHKYLSERIEQGVMLAGGLPSVAELAHFLNVTPRYLTDLLKSLTGLSAQQHIHEQLIENAKLRLSHSSQTVAEIAYALGFEHPQSFSKLFKQKTQMSPVAYRQSFN